MYRIWQTENHTQTCLRTSPEACEILKQAVSPPEVHLFPRVDGPGSSQDLPQFAAMGNRMVSSLDPLSADWLWSRGSLRTPGGCLDMPPVVFRAVPADNPNAWEYYSPDFHNEPQQFADVVPGHPSCFVPNILAQFGLRGVRIEAEPMPAIYRGTGLGGSNLAHTATLVLASALTAACLSASQIYICGAQLENNFGVSGDTCLQYGVSMTGGQESLTSLQGGFWDNVHLPVRLGPYGVVSREIISESRYGEVAERMLLVNTGCRRGEGVTSTDVNSEWMKQWRSATGAEVHLAKREIAYRSVEALRLGNWDEYRDTVCDYRQLRFQLCPAYLAGQKELADLCLKCGAEYFPLGAGSGTCLVTSPEPQALSWLSAELAAQERAEYFIHPVQLRKQGIVTRFFEENSLLPPSIPDLLAC